MINITFTADPLPDDFQGTLADFRERFLLNLRGTIQDTDVLHGRINGEKPSTNIGPWLNNDTWYAWNGSEYSPVNTKIGNTDFAVTLQESPSIGPTTSSITGNKVQTLQDKNGVIATLEDVYEGRPTVVLTGVNPTIDWNLGETFTLLLSGDTTFKTLNQKEGQEAWVLVRNSGTSYTVTWPAAIFFSGGSPTQSEDAADLYILKNIGGTVVARQIAGYS